MQKTIYPINYTPIKESLRDPFSCYANDLPRNLKHCLVHMYADDVQIYLGTTINSLDESVSKVNADLENVHIWASSNGLCLNPSKSKCLIIHGRTRKNTFDANVVINGQRIEIVHSAKNLGIMLNYNLTWSSHINSAVGATYGKLRSLWATQAFTPKRIRILLAKSVLMPSLLYGCELFSCCDSVSTKRLKLIFNNICRYVYGVRKYEHISPFSTKLYGVSFENLLKIRTLSLLQKVVFTKSPSYLFEKLSFARSNRGNILIPLRHRTLVSDWHFFIHSIRLWNNLPNHIQTTSNATHFRKLLFEHYS